MRQMNPVPWAIVATALLVLAPATLAGDPTELLRGEAPLLFTGAEGEDADATLLADGVSAIRGDEIWLWVPALDGGKQVDLGAPGQFFRIWDSGLEAGPDGNDDDDNGMRGMDFDASTGTFLISYEDTTTTGFTFGDILDGDLMRMTPVAVTDGAVTSFTFARLYSECANGTAGCIGTGDINAINLGTDGSLYYGSGAAQTINTDVPGTLAVGSSTIVHADGLTGSSPLNLGASAFFEPTVSGCPLTFCPGIYTGQLRGVDILTSGELTFGTSGNYQNTVFSKGGIEIGVETVCEKADICSVPQFHLGGSLLEQRTGEVLYSGSLFYVSPNVGDAEILDHDILDTAMEIEALINVIGANSAAGLALAAHLPDVQCDSDLDGDLEVAFSDLLIVLSNWGVCPVPPPGDCEGDIDGDGTVGFSDLLQVLGFWGPC